MFPSINYIAHGVRLLLKPVSPATCLQFVLQLCHVNQFIALIFLQGRFQQPPADKRHFQKCIRPLVRIRQLRPRGGTRAAFRVGALRPCPVVKNPSSKVRRAVQQRAQKGRTFLPSYLPPTCGTTIRAAAVAARIDPTKRPAAGRTGSEQAGESGEGSFLPR